MEKKFSVAQLYGYIVCIVTVVVILISIAALVSAIFDFNDPMHAEAQWRRMNLSSFEAYKIDVMKAQPKDQPIPDDETLHAAYEAAKNDWIEGVRFRAKRSLTISTLLIVISLILFITHWLWLRKLAKT